MNFLHMFPVMLLRNATFVTPGSPDSAML